MEGGGSGARIKSQAFAPVRAEKEEGGGLVRAPPPFLPFSLAPSLANERGCLCVVESNSLRDLDLALPNRLRQRPDVIKDPRLLVRRPDERRPFRIEDGERPLGGRVDEGEDVQPRAELVLESERVVPRAFVRAEHDW